MNLDKIIKDSVFTRRDWMRYATILGASVARRREPAAGRPTRRLDAARRACESA